MIHDEHMMSVKEHYCQETTGGEFRVYRASIRYIDLL